MKTNPINQQVGGTMEKKGFQMIGITAIKEKMGIQRDRAQIRELETCRVDKKNCVKNERYHGN
jgi:hypothetical protein